MNLFNKVCGVAFLIASIMSFFGWIEPDRISYGLVCLVAAIACFLEVEK